MRRENAGHPGPTSTGSQSALGSSQPQVANGCGQQNRNTAPRRRVCASGCVLWFSVRDTAEQSGTKRPITKGLAQVRLFCGVRPTQVTPSPGPTADLPAAGGAKTHPLLDQVQLPALSLPEGEQGHKASAAGGHQWISAELLATLPAAGCQPVEKPGGAQKHPGTRSKASPSRATAWSREPPRRPSPAKPIWFYSFAIQIAHGLK